MRHRLRGEGPANCSFSCSERFVRSMSCKIRRAAAVERRRRSRLSLVLLVQKRTCSHTRKAVIHPVYLSLLVHPRQDSHDHVTPSRLGVVTLLFRHGEPLHIQHRFSCEKTTGGSIPAIDSPGEEIMAGKMTERPDQIVGHTAALLHLYYARLDHCFYAVLAATAYLHSFYDGPCTASIPTGRQGRRSFHKP